MNNEGMTYNRAVCIQSGKGPDGAVRGPRGVDSGQVQGQPGLVSVRIMDS